MKRSLLSLATLVPIAILAIGVSGPSNATASTTAAVESWWRCPSGYAFETSGSAVHCKKPAWTETKPVVPCLVPTPDFKLDYSGNTDVCAGSASMGVSVTVTAPLNCYPTDVAAGFTKRIVSGRDFCGKNHPTEIIAPNRQVSM